MDEMKLTLSTNFMKNIIASIVHKTIKKQVGYKVTVGIRELDVSYENGKAHVHTNIDLVMDNDEFAKLMKNIAGWE